MSDADSEGVYRCPLCRVPAPSVAACKIHISRQEDTVHLGYAGNDLHEEIVTGAVIDNPAGDGHSLIQVGGLNLLSSFRQTIRELLASLK